MDIYVKLCSTLVVLLLLPLLIIVLVVIPFVRSSQTWGCQGQNLQIFWHVWVFFLFQLIWLSFPLHFLWKERVILSRSNDFKTYLGGKWNIQDSQRDLISLHKSLSPLSATTSISSTFLAFLTTFPVELNNLPSHLTAAVIIKITKPIQRVSSQCGGGLKLLTTFKKA